MKRFLPLFLITLFLSANAENIYSNVKVATDDLTDMTHMIANPAFDSNDNTGWNGVGIVNSNVVEYYQKTFDMNQTIKGLPAGKYILKAKTFERPKGNDSGTAYANGTEVIYAKLYAKSTGFAEMTTPFNSLYQHKYSGTGSQNSYVNTMSAAETVFKNYPEYYETIIEGICINEGDELTIGAKTDFIQSGYWTLFDDFRLYYVGENITDEDLVNSITSFITKAESLKSERMSNAALLALTEAIEEGYKASGKEIFLTEELTASNNKLCSTTNEAVKSVDAYNDLDAIIIKGNKYLEVFIGDKASALNSAIEEAKLVVVDFTVELSKVENATKKINNLIAKKIYSSIWMMGDIYNPENQWSIERSHESDNWIIFWEKGYGVDPRVVTDGSYRIDTDALLELADKCFYYYADSLKFITRGASKSDDYKMIIRLRHTREWEATGSGFDDTIGLLTLTAWSAQAAGHTLAHEVGHCFQYQVHCDNNNNNGWMYGYGSDGAGGNGWWEQCAQWMGYKIYPSQQFTDSNFAEYLKTVHKHILHETPRYDNYFIQDYWVSLHGLDFIGRLWNESAYPEDPVETYKRITGVTQKQFLTEMYDCAAKFATWDIPALKSYGSSKLLSRPTVKMNNLGDYTWQIDSTMCPENYGHNIIRLNAPSAGKVVSASFEGIAGASGFRTRTVNAACWNFGFVAYLRDGSSVYSDMSAVTKRSNIDTVRFEIPANCRYLWLVVSAGPSTHWKHPWDNNDANDEQWPYQVKFDNTNLYGQPNVTSISNVSEDFSDIFVDGNQLMVNNLADAAQIMVVDITGRIIINDNVTEINNNYTLPSGIYIVKVVSGGQLQTKKIIIQN